MKLSADTGKISFGSGADIGPETVRSSFLVSPLFIGVRVLVENEPYVTYAVDVPNEKMSLSVSFHGEVLESVRISTSGAEFGSSWNDWSEEKELARAEANSLWLSQQGVTTSRPYSWGAVWSGFEGKSAFSSVIVRYSSAANNSLQARRP